MDKSTQGSCSEEVELLRTSAGTAVQAQAKRLVEVKDLSRRTHPFLAGTTLDDRLQSIHHLPEEKSPFVCPSRDFFQPAPQLSILFVCDTFVRHDKSPSVVVRL